MKVRRDKGVLMDGWRKPTRPRLIPKIPPMRSKERKGRRRRREIHLLSAVVGRRNNWLLSPGKFPDQFLHVTEKRKLLSSTDPGEEEQEQQQERQQERGLRKLARQAKGGGSRRRTEG